MSRTRTRRRRAVAWALSVVGAFALGMLLTWMLSPVATTGSWDGDGDGAGDGVGEADQPVESFTISGDLTEPVSPGVLSPLNLSITNPHDAPMIVTVLSVTVTHVRAPNASQRRPCTVDDFTVEQVRDGFEVIVAAGFTATLGGLDVPSGHWPQVGMLDTSSNQDGCKGASLTLGYSAVGRLEE